MCGILGFISNDKKIFKNFNYKNSLKTLLNRGPDKTNFIKEKNFFFGHTRLSIIGTEENSANQPVSRKDKILVFNGEIYNFKKLSKELNLLGVFDRGKSDTETLFNSLQFFGVEKTLSKIDGMYAFTYYDVKKNQLYLVRDRIGEKPLYFYKNNNYFIFSSEIKAIIASNIKSFQPNVSMFHEILLFGKIYGEQTAFKNILEVEPGTFLKINFNNNLLEKKRYWNLEEFNINNKKVKSEEFDERFEDCVKTRLVSDVPIGSLLSGGIDSSSLAYKMIHLGLQKNYNFFFAKNTSRHIDEYKDVKYFYNFLKKNFCNKTLNLNVVKTSLSDYWKNLSNISYINDEPCTFNNFYLVYNLTKKIKQKKIKVIFSGEGADEILFGYERFARTNNNFSNNFHKNMQSIFFGESFKDLDIIEKIVNTDDLLGKIFNSESWKYLNKISKYLDLNRAQMIFSQKYRLTGLLQRQDRAAMSNSVESRAPFLKPDFVKWMNSISIENKYDEKNNETKVILRNSMDKYLNKNITSRKKIGFGNDFDLELKKEYAIEKIKKIIMNKNSFTSNYFEKNNTLKILRDKKSLEKNINIIRFILNIEMWHQAFFK